MREWLTPVAVGLIAAALTLALPAPGPEAPAEDRHAAPEVDWVFPFEDGPVMHNASGQVLVISHGERPDEIRWLEGMDDGVVAVARPTWIGPLGVIDMEAYSKLSEEQGDPTAPWQIIPSDAPGFDANGTVRLTLYAFDAHGELVASNAPAILVDRFPLFADYIPISQSAWYVGNDTPPDGALTLPFGSDLARAALDGQPVGAIVTVHIETHPYDWLVGELWLTARIDSFTA